ncbi:MAG: DUF1475 domain-containing protein [Planctomycetes bacterium]|nr:DUF1475 domain-containing protein [Planctomycetota bacterium]
MMRSMLLSLFALILLVMIVTTGWASLDRSVLQAGYLFAEPWFVATFMDAYCGFLTFYVWVAYKEPGNLARVAWFAAIMLFGNIAMAVYMIVQLLRLRRDESWEHLLLRRSDARNIIPNHEAL